jgi:hypothetical protein
MNDLKKMWDSRDTEIEIITAFRRIRIYESLGWNYQVIRGV